MKETAKKMEQKKKKNILFVLICALIRLFYRKPEFVGTENLPGEPCVIVGNHTQMNGPIISELYFPGKNSIWCAGQMMHWGEVADYAFTDFWSFKPKIFHPFFRLLSWIITPLAVLIFNNASTVPVYHDTRLITTFRRSIELLQEGRSMIIFPEWNKRYNNILYDFQDKFVDLARFYYKKYGVALSFVPMYLAPRLSRIFYGEPVRFDPAAPIADERARICEVLMDRITDMAVAQPEHVVVPYPNIPKRRYPHNIPLEVYVNEKADI